MMRLRGALPCALTILGLLQTVGFLTGSAAIRGIGLASTASPLPLVFTQFRGLETFAEDYSLEILTVSGKHIETPITPALYGKLKGPYKRRNTYGAVISYGPGLTLEPERRLVDTVLTYGFCDGGPLSREFGITERLREAHIHITSRTAGRPGKWTLSVQCRTR
jgi:hypothetical protein